ncbi:pyridoxal-phosphate-dependent aminotransferase family protein [Endomicrobium proavitum]|uniref:Class V aminotransferase n=1 Tax=Endomicrobium proavitum TaxID=1408281 RepID=A0A0G3WHB8_9BACT|nr:alanine--glyoxylate aminotransferase family protein [Endomicrobium proavitum]AKL97723.1 class V aminotransferase [Endomicrobium proavitum]
MKKHYLLTPGPTPIPPEVALKEALPILHHRTGEFAAIYKDVAEGLKYVFQTKNEVYTVAGSGTATMEIAVVNLLSAGDEIIVAGCGNFGDRWAKIAQSYGVKVISASAPWGNVVKPAEIEKALKENPNVKAVYTTFTETSTGVVNDIKAIGDIVSKTNAVLVVDTISGLVGQEFRTDEWKVDVAVSGSQKGFMLAPGLAFITLSEKAWKLAETSKLPKFYFDIKKYKKSYATNETPFTPPVTLIVSLQESIRLIKERGIENLWNDYKLLAKAARAGMKALGLELYGEVPCEVVTSAQVPEAIGGKIVKTLREKYGVSIAGGQGDLKGKIIRFAHMGYIGKADLLVGFACLEMVLTELGLNVEKGKAVAAAETELLRG